MPVHIFHETRVLYFFVFIRIFILFSRENDESAITSLKLILGVAGTHFYVMFPASVVPCIFLTKRGFINAILCEIATTVL